MKIIDFIEQDSKKIKTQNKWHFILAILIIVLSLFIGYGSRGDFNEAFEWFNIMPSLLLMICIAAAVFIISKKENSSHHLYLFLSIASLFLFTTLTQMQTQISLSKFLPTDSFWRENIHCLWIGGLGGLSISISMLVLLFNFFPMPNKKQSFIYSMLSGFGSALILSLHCPGPLISHIIISHWGALLMTFIFQFIVSQLLLKIKASLIFSQN